MKKLKVHELENRIAPSVGLWGFIQSLAAADSQVGEMVNAIFDDQGNVTDVGAATDAANQALADAGSLSQVSAVRDSFNVSNLFIRDETAEMISALFSNR